MPLDIHTQVSSPSMFNLGWPCNLLYQIECSGSDAVQLWSLGLKRFPASTSFHLETFHFEPNVTQWGSVSNHDKKFTRRRSKVSVRILPWAPSHQPITNLPTVWTGPLWAFWPFTPREGNCPLYSQNGTKYKLLLQASKFWGWVLRHKR